MSNTLSPREVNLLTMVINKEGFHDGLTKYSDFDGKVRFNQVESPVFHGHLKRYRTLYSEFSTIIQDFKAEDLMAYDEISRVYCDYKIIADEALYRQINCTSFHRHRRKFRDAHNAFADYIKGETGNDVMRIE